MTWVHISHAIIHTLLSTLLAISLALNWLFYEGNLHMDTEKIAANRITEEVFNTSDKPAKKK